MKGISYRLSDVAMPNFGLCVVWVQPRVRDSRNVQLLLNDKPTSKGVFRRVTLTKLRWARINTLKILNTKLISDKIFAHSPKVSRVAARSPLQRFIKYMTWTALKRVPYVYVQHSKSECLWDSLVTRPGYLTGLLRRRMYPVWYFPSKNNRFPAVFEININTVVAPRFAMCNVLDKNRNEFLNDIIVTARVSLLKTSGTVTHAT